MLRSVLVGQPELRRMMGRPSMQQLRERVIAFCHLGFLGASKARAIIEHRLQHAVVDQILWQQQASDRAS
jgi:general secretion pathway protein A